MYHAYKIIRTDLLQDGFYFKMSTILEMKGKTYLSPEGHFNLYEWNGEAWINQYTGHYYGYNFSSKKFVLHDKIYSFGGNGYWKWHGQIISFTQEKGQWDLVDFARDLKNEYAFLNSKGLQLLGNSNLTVDFTRKKIDHKNKPAIHPSLVWQPDVQTVESEKYYIIGTNPVTVIEKEQENIYFSDSDRLKNILNSYKNPVNLILIHGDTITTIDSTWTTIANYPIAKEVKTAKPVKSTDKTGYAFLIVPALALSLFFWIKRRKRIAKNTTSIQPDENTPYLQKLRVFSDKMITTEQLDEMLEINTSVHQESVRYRRSLLINSINEDYKLLQNKELITRVRDPKDGRKFMYKIEF